MSTQDVELEVRQLIEGKIVRGEPVCHDWIVREYIKSKGRILTDNPQFWEEAASNMVSEIVGRLIGDRAEGEANGAEPLERNAKELEQHANELRRYVAGRMGIKAI